MMAGSKAFRFIQLGTESPQGTPVAASTIWRGMGVIKDQRDIVRPKEHVGVAGGTTRKYSPRHWSELAMPEVEATFEQLPYLLEAGVSTETPTADGTGSGYIYNYLSPVAAQNTIKTFTVEGGDDQQAEEFDFGFVKKLTLAGSAQGALMMSADWMGRVVTNSTKTAAQAVPAVEEIFVNDAKIYIDDSGGSVGGSVVSSTLFEISLDWVTGLEAFWAVDGSKDFSLIKYVDELEAMVLTLTYEHNGSAVTEKAKYQAQSDRLIRLLFEGTDLVTAGSVYSKKSLVLDMAGFYNDWSALEDVDGNDVIKAEFVVAYATADTLKMDATVVNALATLP
jgi:hypothetical protein